MKLVTQDAGVDGVETADFRTLRMSTPGVDEAALGRFLAYQRAYVELLEQAAVRTSELVAEAHARALAASGATLDEVGRLGALCTDYAGRRSVERTLEGNRAELAGRLDALRAGGGHPSPKELELEQKLTEELRPPGALEKLAARHGETAISVLRGHEEALLELHRRQLRVHL